MRLYRRLSLGAINTSPYSGLLLKKISEDQWAIFDTVSQTMVKPEANKNYGFVTMPDKSIRIMPAVQRAHGLLSGLAPYIRYAGEIQFNENQEMKIRSNQCGTYQPSEDLFYQAELENDKFCPFHESNNESENEKHDSNTPKKRKFI